MILSRNSDVFACVVAVGLLLLWLMFADARAGLRHDEQAMQQRRQIVAALRLTDLCLTTEARHTRHPALADRHAPFQDHPLALDRFPSGAIMPPPPHLGPRDGGD